MTDGLDLTGDHFVSLLPSRVFARRRRPHERSGLRPLPEAIADLERASIRAALEATGGRRGAAAKLLQIPRSSFYEKLAQHGILSEETT